MVMRNNLNITFVCSKCRESLDVRCFDTLPSDRGLSSETGADNAYEVSVKASIVPCKTCYGKLERPIAILKDILK